MQAAENFCFELRSRLLCLLLVLCFALGVILFLFNRSQSIHSLIINVSCRFGGEEWSECELPFLTRADRQILEVKMDLEGGESRNSRVRFWHAGCLTQILLNGEVFHDPKLPTCEPNVWQTFNLSPFLQEGRNTLHVRLERSSPFTIFQFDLRTVAADRIAFLLTVLLPFLIGACAILFYRVFLRQKFRLSLVHVFLLGVLLRLLFISATPYTDRAYDLQGHKEYIEYVTEHFRIPPHNLGWETHQPPLYYFLAVSWMKIGSLFLPTNESLWEWVQVLSLILSFTVLAVCLWIAVLLFPGEHERRERLFFASIFAVFPGLVYFAARINNDSLSHLLAFLFFAFLIRFWNGGKMRDWILTSVIISLGLLTKSTAWLLLPVSLLVLFFRKSSTIQGMIHRTGTSERKVYGKSKLLLLTMSILLLIAGWLPLLRFGIEGQHGLIGGSYVSDPNTIVETDIRHFFLFNPLRILKCVPPVDTLDHCGRGFFFEYLFRSSLLSSFQLQSALIPVAASLLLLGLLLLPLIALGVWKNARFKDMALPLLILSCVLLAGHILFRLRYPYPFNQDFRFSVLLLVPLTFFLVRGMEELNGRWRYAGLCLYSTFLLSSCSFFISLLFV